MKKLPKTGSYATLKTIAETVGLSRTTVAEIMNGDARYAEETRRRVLDASRQLNYQPNRSAQSIRRGRSNLIGVMHAGGTLQVANERALHLGRFIMKTGYEIWLADSLWLPANSDTLLDRLFAARVEGFVFSGPSGLDSDANSQIIAQLTEANVPIVGLSAPAAKNVTTVNADFAGGFDQLAKHLIEIGHRRLTLLLAQHPASSWHGVQRQAGFIKAIQKAGGQVAPPVAVQDYRPRWSGKGLQGEVIYATDTSREPFMAFDIPQSTMERLLDHGFSADAVMASNDEWAASVISVCLRRGLDVPRQLAVTGFDNSAISKLSPIPITTASQQNEEACRIAVDTLLRRMQGSEEADSNITIPCPIIVRASSGGGMRLSAP